MHTNDNSEIYSELELLVGQPNDEDLIPDIDKINLLIDTLKYRIGPTGRERQAKIEYHFKNIVNTLLPGLHRYLMKSASLKTDIFSQEDDLEPQKISWTDKIFKQINMSESQKRRISIMGPALK